MVVPHGLTNVSYDIDAYMCLTGRTRIKSSGSIIRLNVLHNMQVRILHAIVSVAVPYSEDTIYSDMVPLWLYNRPSLIEGLTSFHLSV